MSSSSSIYSLISNPFFSISSSFLIISSVCLFLACLSFYCLQFCFNLSQYFLLYLLSNYPNSFFTVNLPGNSPLLNISSSCSYLLMSFMFYQYSFSNSSTTSFAFPKFSFLSQVFDSAVNPFYLTKYLSFFLICHLFKILLTFYSSSLSVGELSQCYDLVEASGIFH